MQRNPSTPTRSCPLLLGVVVFKGFMMTYQEQLRHPKWQKKRLEIMEENNFTCQNCGSTEKTLNVHHGYYEKGLFAWEYPDSSLHCLCEICHTKYGIITVEIHRKIGSLNLGQLQMVVDLTAPIGFIPNPEIIPPPPKPSSLVSIEYLISWAEENLPNSKAMAGIVSSVKQSIQRNDNLDKCFSVICLRQSYDERINDAKSCA